MLNLDTLKDQYVVQWASAGADETNFLSTLAAQGVITYDDLNEYLTGQAAPTLEGSYTLPGTSASAALPSVFTLEMVHADLWQLSGYDHREFVNLLIARGIITTAQSGPLIAEVEEFWTETQQLTSPLPTFTERIGTALWTKTRDYFVPVFEAVLRSTWSWVRESASDLWVIITEWIWPRLKQGLDWLNAQFEDLGRRAYDGMMKLMLESGPVTPERAPALALKLYTFAFSMGMAAHTVSATCELLSPLKNLGVHHTAAMLGDFASFGRLATATMGVMTSIALGRPMAYAANAMMQNIIPDEKLLIEFRAKREIDYEEFAKAMRYQGFDDYWTKIIERWQWKDPRMLEIVRMADAGLDQGEPPAEELPWLTRFGITGDRLKDWWLYRKYMRAGYEDCDIPVMVRFIHRRMSSFAMTYVRTAIRRNYRWGFMDEEELGEWMERLNLPEESKTWIRWAGELDREYFYREDLITLYTQQFRKDLITSDEFYVALLAMGLPERSADITVAIEEARKVPKVTQPAAEGAGTATTAVQKQYVQLYLQQYRKNLIGNEQLYYSLTAIGLKPELAEVTVSLEETKKFKP